MEIMTPNASHIKLQNTLLTCNAMPTAVGSCSTLASALDDSVFKPTFAGLIVDFCVSDHCSWFDCNLQTHDVHDDYATPQSHLAAAHRHHSWA